MKRKSVYYIYIYVGQFPISFAINFTVTSEKNILAPQCAVPKAAEQKETKSQSSQPKQSDEADTGRLAVIIDFDISNEYFI